MTNRDRFREALKTDENVRKTYERLSAEGGDEADILLATAKACGFELSREDLTVDKEKMSAADLDKVAGGKGYYYCEKCQKHLGSFTALMLHDSWYHPN